MSCYKHRKIACIINTKLRRGTKQTTEIGSECPGHLTRTQENYRKSGFKHVTKAESTISSFMQAQRNKNTTLSNAKKRTNLDPNASALIGKLQSCCGLPRQGQGGERKKLRGFFIRQESGYT